jgi:nitrite reductase/ring-hydroxylating ferredoxin subunit
MSEVWIGRDLPAIWRDGVEYFVVSRNEELYLVPNRCPHRGGPLKFGYLNERNELVCPMHGSAFSIETLLSGPDVRRLREVLAASPDAV